MKDKFKEAGYKRTHVYLEDRYEKPKYLFQVVADKIESAAGKGRRCSLLDIGAATGEFAYYLSSRFPDSDFACLEYDRKLCEHGKERIKTCRFVCGDANDMSMFKDGEFDFVTMIGVLSIFDDYAPSISECIRVCKNGGSIFIVSQFNEYAVDVLMRWRYSEDRGPYNKGYNLFSKKTISDFLGTKDKVLEWEFEKFVLPFDLKRSDDLIRTWTEFDKDGRRILKNGLGMEINLQVLTISLKDSA